MGRRPKRWHQRLFEALKARRYLLACHDSQPLLGVVHAPVTASGITDCIAWAEGMDHLVRNGRRIVADLSDQLLTEKTTVMVSAAADGKPKINSQLCAPAAFHAMPSIAYRLAKVAAGDGVCGCSLYPVSAHDVVAGHALLIGAKGVLVDENGAPVRYTTEDTMTRVSGRVFGGSASACFELSKRDWSRLKINIQFEYDQIEASLKPYAMNPVAT